MPAREYKFSSPELENALGRGSRFRNFFARWADIANNYAVKRYAKSVRKTGKQLSMLYGQLEREHAPNEREAIFKKIEEKSRFYLQQIAEAEKSKQDIMNTLKVLKEELKVKDETSDIGKIGRTRVANAVLNKLTGRGSIEDKVAILDGIITLHQVPRDGLKMFIAAEGFSRLKRINARIMEAYQAEAKISYKPWSRISIDKIVAAHAGLRDYHTSMIEDNQKLSGLINTLGLALGKKKAGQYEIDFGEPEEETEEGADHSSTHHK